MRDGPQSDPEMGPAPHLSSQASAEGSPAAESWASANEAEGSPLVRPYVRSLPLRGHPRHLLHSPRWADLVTSESPLVKPVEAAGPARLRSDAGSTQHFWLWSTLVLLLLGLVATVILGSRVPWSGPPPPALPFASSASPGPAASSAWPASSAPDVSAPLRSLVSSAPSRSVPNVAPSARMMSPSPPATLKPTAAPTFQARRGWIGGIAGTCLDVNGAAAFDGNYVKIWVCNGTPAQDWSAGTDGTLQVVSYCLRTTNDVTSLGTTVEIWTCDGSAAQQWRFTNGEILNPATGLCLTSPDDAATLGTRLVGARCQSKAGQQWTPPPVV